MAGGVRHLMAWKDGAVCSPEAQRKRRQHQEEELLQKASFQDGDSSTYSGHPLRPCCFLFEHLKSTRLPRGSERPSSQAADRKNIVTCLRIPVRIPPTLVAGGPSGMILFSTDATGMLCRSDQATVKSFKQALGLSISQDLLPVLAMDGGMSMLPDPEDVLNQPPVGVIKRPKYSGYTNEAHVLTAKQTLVTASSQAPGQVAVLQRYVKSRSPTASVTRLVWVLGKGAFAYQLGNRIKCEDVEREKDPSKRWLASAEVLNGVNVFVMKGRALDPLVAMAQGLLQLLTNTLKPQATFEEFVADFVKDQEGAWWFLQTKAFRLAPVRGPLAGPRGHHPDGPDPSTGTRRCPVYRDGALAAPSSGTLTVYNPSAVAVG